MQSSQQSEQIPAPCSRVSQALANVERGGSRALTSVESYPLNGSQAPASVESHPLKAR